MYKVATSKSTVATSKSIVATSKTPTCTWAHPTKCVNYETPLRVQQAAQLLRVQRLQETAAGKVPLRLNDNVVGSGRKCASYYLV